MTRDEAKAILNEYLGLAAGAGKDYSATIIRILDAAGAFTRERTPAEVLGYQTVRGKDGKPRLVRPEPTITKAQAKLIWDLACTEPGLVGYFDEAWAEVTGAKPGPG